MSEFSAVVADGFSLDALLERVAEKAGPTVELAGWKRLPCRKPAITPEYVVSVIKP